MLVNRRLTQSIGELATRVRLTKRNLLYQYEVCDSKRSVNEWKHDTRSTVYGKTQVVLNWRCWLLGADVFIAGLGYAPNNAV